ncbi:MAG: Rrf2 family transcriptional regulator [Sphingomonadales bacterium]|nr:Rrf2 family transcriptional regulator [Sphingomonadales bacterium]MDE2567712.1 Rrf2 family transcriptional regulator [Sphingomonadales bacterium]
MHLSLQTDYGLRILMLLASTNRQMSVDQIARSYGISRNHLAKVAQHLQSAGYIETSRGRGGGLRLGRPAGELNVGKIVRDLESLDAFVECMAPLRNMCPALGLCGLQNALGLALGDFLSRLDSYTVADLLPDPARFSRQLGSDAGLPGS